MRSPKLHYRVRESSPLVSAFSGINRDHIFMSYLFTVLILSSHLCINLASRVSGKNVLRVSHPSYSFVICCCLKKVRIHIMKIINIVFVLVVITCVYFRDKHVSTHRQLELTQKHYTETTFIIFIIYIFNFSDTSKSHISSTEYI